jgi:hypothetical protein
MSARDLQRTHGQLTLLLDGLHAMRPDELAVPGTEACSCIEMVTKTHSGARESLVRSQVGNLRIATLKPPGRKSNPRA